MTKSDKIILQIVCKALDRNYKIDKRQLKDISWVEVMDIVTTQGVLGICFDVIEQFDATCGLDMENLMD